jgi:hypothetical protein
MTFEEFRQSLQSSSPPAVAPAIVALWHDARGDWAAAHAVAQDVDDEHGGAWVHAYLHRKEGDLSNAAYWYRRAGKPVESGGLEAERDRIAAALLTDDEQRRR